MRYSWQRPIHLLGLCIALLAVAQIGLAHQRNGLSQQISVMEGEQQGLKAEIDQLNLELASLTRPERLRALATSELGMLAPTARQMVRP